MLPGLVSLANKGPSSGFTPPGDTFRILTEGGDALITEGGDAIKTEE